MPPENEPKPIGLTELIYQVKRELLSPENRRRDPVPLFAVDEIELEVAVTVSREGQAGINIQVFSVGGGASREDVQTVRVKLKPLRSREELIADLQQRDPQLFATMTEESLSLLKGGQAAGNPPMSWP
jgi:hypothetical protein